MAELLKEKAASGHPAATSKVLHEDERSRITQWSIKRGEVIDWHFHEFEYLIVQQSEGRLRIERGDGSADEFDYTPGGVLVGQAPIEHKATNVGDVDIVSLEIEYKK